MRRQPYAQVAEIEKNVQELLAAKLIEPTISPWSSNVLLVRRKDGAMRLCRLPQVKRKDGQGLVSTAKFKQLLRVVRW
jgi:hypothetical protein